MPFKSVQALNGESGRAGMAEIVVQMLVDPFLVGQDHAAKATALAVNMLGGGIDDDMGAQLQRLLQKRRCKDVIDDDLGADLVGDLGDALDIDHFQRRVGRAFQEETTLVFRLDGLFPVFQEASIDQREFDAVFRRQRFHHPAAGAEQGAGRHDMIAGFQLAQDRGGHRSHAGCGGACVLGTFQHAHALFEHVVGRAAIAGIDEAVRLALEARFRRFRAVIDEALRHEDGFGGFTMV